MVPYVCGDPGFSPPQCYELEKGVDIFKGATLVLVLVLVLVLEGVGVDRGQMGMSTGRRRVGRPGKMDAREVQLVDQILGDGRLAGADAWGALVSSCGGVSAALLASAQSNQHDAMYCATLPWPSRQWTTWSRREGHHVRCRNARTPACPALFGCYGGV